MRPVRLAVLSMLLLWVVPAWSAPLVIIETSRGEIKLELYSDKAPETVNNFVTYAKSGFYDGTIFHRVVDNFMIQGGGFSTDLKQKETRPPIRNEADNGLRNERGTIAMARTQVVDSATSQFFINLKDNDFLNHSGKNPRQYGYAVFGRVLSGMDVVDAIGHTAVANRGGAFQNLPVDQVVIRSVKVLEK